MKENNINNLSNNDNKLVNISSKLEKLWILWQIMNLVIK